MRIRKLVNHGIPEGAGGNLHVTPPVGLKDEDSKQSHSSIIQDRRRQGWDGWAKHEELPG